MDVRIFIDGYRWCALHGENLQEGMAGFGRTPVAALIDLGKRWARRWNIDDAQTAPAVQTGKEESEKEYMGKLDWCCNCALKADVDRAKSTPLSSAQVEEVVQDFVAVGLMGEDMHNPEGQREWYDYRVREYLAHRSRRGEQKTTKEEPLPLDGMPECPECGIELNPVTKECRYPHCPKYKQPVDYRARAVALTKAMNRYFDKWGIHPSAIGQIEAALRDFGVEE